MNRRKRNPLRIILLLLHPVIVIIGAVTLTLAFFLVLPLMQTLSKPPDTDMVVQSVNTAKLEAPDPPAEPEPEEEPEEEPEPPELMEDAQPLDLSQLELALNPTFSDGMMAGDFTVKLKTIGSDGDGVDALFSIADLDQKPRVVYQPGPSLSSKHWKRAPGKVYIVFIVDKNGRVEKPMVQKSSDPIFEKPALSAVKQWKFEPGKRGGKPVRFRMRVPIVIPRKGS